MSENSTQVQTKPKKFKIKIKKNKVEVGNVKTQHIINDDCIKQMKKMNSDSVDIIICDPPYNIGKDFGNNSEAKQYSGRKVDKEWKCPFH